MAKVTHRVAGPDDPIYKGGVVFSSMKLPRKPAPSEGTSQKGAKDKKPSGKKRKK